MTARIIRRNHPGTPTSRTRGEASFVTERSSIRERVLGFHKSEIRATGCDGLQSAGKGTAQQQGIEPLRCSGWLPEPHAVKTVLHRWRRLCCKPVGSNSRQV